MEEDIRFRGIQVSRTATWKSLISVFLRCLVTLLLSLAIWKVLWFYSDEMIIMAKPATRDFNVWITGLTIALGLAFANSLDKLTKDTRWWTLSRRHRSRRKVEAILETENIVAVLRMAFTSRRVTIHITALSRFLVVVASQIGLAVLGLFYSVDISDKLALQVMPGNVSIVNMSLVHPLGFVFSNSQSRSDQEYAANMVPFAVGTGQTTFMTNTSTNCGPGCSTVTACETAAKDPWFYSCNTTVDPVTNSTIAEHEVPELVRLLAAQAIALQGFSVNSTLSNSDPQYQVYPSQSPLGTSLQGMVQAMELTMSRFAAGAIAMVANVNSDIVVDRLPPTKGSSLNVDHWDYVCMVVAFMATKVVIPPEGATSMAKVLHAMVASESSGGTEWIYRSRMISADGIYDLYLEGRPRGELDGNNI
ncbi:hypothetical protein FOBRF1_006494 [Fusarium oxysporum]